MSPYTPTWNNPYMQSPYLPQMPQVQPYQQPVNGIVKVNGRDSAMQYQLPPNSMSPALFDKDGGVFYVVSTDGTGTKTVETFDFSPHVDEKPVTIDGAQFVSRKEFEEFTAKVNAAIGALDGVHGSVSTSAPTDTTHPVAGQDQRGAAIGAGQSQRPTLQPNAD